MNYHAKLEHSGKFHFWWNQSKTEERIKEVKGIHTASSAQSVLQLAFAPTKNQVFVIMKFDSQVG